MSPKQPDRSKAPSRDDRLAKALRENLARRKALVRVRREKGDDDAPAPDGVSDTGRPRTDDEAPS